MIWKPNTTVAAIVEHNGLFLLVEEETAEGIRLNQPAGHVEKGESLLEAVVRETREESAYRFTPQHLLGIYHWRHPLKDITYLRFAFIGKVDDHRPTQALDDGILRTLWLSPEEIRASHAQHRSPQVLTCIEHYLAGQHFPLNVITHL
ncbi:NUDIX hydrolase [Methylobacillus gramineus]|uniref:NUDIX hydrolase n=1 Tax=Methylobacillus gramineus TaxID=755169 RepID=UPI001CFF88B6|nr:NUDIX hydrolase [Methylobacillus gramineus]MCB5186357.1 NUDIX hydrolase [Methylobacillus gramineus]